MEALAGAIAAAKMKGTEVQNPRRFTYVHVEYMYVCKQEHMRRPKGGRSVQLRIAA